MNMGRVRSVSCRPVRLYSLTMRAIGASPLSLAIQGGLAVHFSLLSARLSLLVDAPARNGAPGRSCAASAPPAPSTGTP